MLGPTQRGVKRKLDEGDDDEENLHSQHRQSVFNISLNKLNRFREVADPSLRRSVLICNTLRHIEQEMLSKGLQISTITATAGFLPSLQTEPFALEPLPPIQSISSATNGEHATQVPPPPDSPIPNSASGQLADLKPTVYEKNLAELDTSGRATPFPSLDIEPTCRLDNGALCYEAEDRLPSINWSSVLNFASQSESDFSNNNNGPCSCVGGPSANSDSSNEIFGDIDLSLYDFDLLPLSPPNVRFAPLSAEELLRSFPSNDGSCYKNELISEELDHIMHILVGM